MNYRQVHLDFHTSEEIKNVGVKFSKKNFQQALKLGHVDSITLFAKCHHGWMYYTSEVSPMHPNLSFDLLSAQIEAATEIGVKTRIYISAGLDERLAKCHPEWLSRDRKDNTTWVKDNVTAGYHLMCYNTPYLDILLAQIKEVAVRFKPEKIFLDISSISPCYCSYCREELKKNGESVLDDNAVNDLATKTYFKYTQAVRSILDSIDPKIGVFHNGGHIVRGRRDIMSRNSYLEVESLPTSAQWGYDHFPLSAAYVRNLDYDYLAMTGKFHTHWGEFGGFKHPNALKYETAIMLSNGAKCSIGDQLHPSGEMDIATYQLIGEAYSEVAKIEKLCDYTQFVADIGVLSCEDFDQANSRDSIAEHIDAGAAKIMMENKFLYDVLDRLSDFQKYKLLILPDRIRINEDLELKIKEFIKNGGKILATGLSGLYESKDCFAFDFGAEFIGQSEYRPNYIKPNFNLKSLLASDFVVYSDAYVVKSKKHLATMRVPYFNRTVDHFCSHQHAPCSQVDIGSGISIGSAGAYIAYQAFGDYFLNGGLPTKEIVAHVINEMLGENKTIETNLPAQGLITLSKNEQRKEYALHIIYGSPVKRGSIEVIEDIVPIYNIWCRINLNEQIKRIYNAKSGKDIPFSLENSKISIQEISINCHELIIFEY